MTDDESDDDNGFHHLFGLAGMTQAEVDALAFDVGVVSENGK